VLPLAVGNSWNSAGMFAIFSFIIFTLPVSGDV